MGLKEFYYGLEDKYYAMLDWLDKHGIPVYKIVDAIEASNVPSFPLFILLCILIICALCFFAFPMLQPSTDITIFLTSEGERISGEKVIIIFEGLPDALTKTSTSNGEVKVSVPIGKQITVKLGESENYTARQKVFTVEKANQEFEFPITVIEKTLSRTIVLLDSEGKLFDKSNLTIRFSCSANSSFNKTATSANGKILLNGIPKNCGYLNYELPQGFNSTTTYLDPNNSSPEIRLSQFESRIGKALVSVKDSEGNALPGKKVQLLAVTATESFQSQFAFSNATGNALFENIPIGIYKAQAIDETGDYFAEPTAAKEVKQNETTNFEIKMQKTSIGVIKFLIVDASTNLPVQNAKVDLYKETTAYGSSKFTDSSGRVEFRVAENLQFNASIDHPAYLKVNGIPASISSSEIKIQLTQATSQNSNLLTVKIVDEKNSPVELTKVKLLKALDASTIEEKTTGVNGIALFERIPEGSYIVKALKPGFGEAVKTTNVVSRQENITILQLVIGSGTINLSVMDEDENPIPNANIEVFDNSTGEKINETTTDNGKKSISVRADKTVYLRVNAEGFMPFYTIPIQMAKDITFEKTIMLLEDAPTLSLEPVGGTALFFENEKLLDSLSPGKKYTAKFLLKIPEGSDFSEAGAHIRTGLPEIAGIPETTQVESEPVYIKNVIAGARAIILKGKTYNPPNDYTKDIQNLTKSEAKWTSIIITKPKEGIYEIEAEIITRENSQIGKNIELRYRAWGKSIGIVRSPKDDELGSAESTSNKQALYAATKNIPFNIGTGSLCNENFCNLFKITDKQNNETTAIIDEFTAKISSQYRLSFNSTFIGNSTKQNTVLKIYNEDSAFEFGNYSIKNQGTASGNSLEIPIGMFSKNDSISGWLDFSTIKEGTTKLIIELKAGSEKLQTKQILFDIKPAKSMNVEVIPKMIVPYISNNLLVKVSEITEDSNSMPAIQNAVVNFILNNVAVASIQTNSKGIAAYTLNSPPNNSKLVIEVKKQGYNTFTKKISINENLLMFQPSEIRDSLVINGVSEKQRTLHLINASPIPLTIKKINFPSMEGLVNFALDSEPLNSFEDANGRIGTVLERDANTEFLLKMKLTEKGKNIIEPTTIKGTIDFELENPNYSVWLSRLPVIITIGFGEEVDSTDCLIVEPAEWIINTESEEKTLEFTLKNNCKINENAIELQDLQAKVSLINQPEIGKFRIASSSLPESKQTELSNQFRNISPLIPKNSENQLIITFTPFSLEAGYSEPKIILKAINKTKNGNQEIETEIKTKTSINDLSKCVRFTVSSTILQTTPYGLGFGQYADYYGSQGYYGFSPMNYWNASTLPSYIVPNTYGTQGVLPTTGPGTVNPPYIVPNTNPSNPAIPTAWTIMANNESNPYNSNIYDASNPYSPYSYGSPESAFTSPFMNPSFPQYFPDLSYNSPYLDSYNQYYGFGSNAMPYYDYFQNQYGVSPYNLMSWQQSTATVRIENACSQTIEIIAESSPALQVQQSNIVLKPKARINVNVEASYRIGVYPITFLGRLQESQDALKELQTILFTVQSASEIARDCISLDRTKFRFNEFIPKPVVGRVFNSCWQIGVRLLETSDALTLTEQSSYIEQRIAGTPMPGLAGRVNILGISRTRIGEVLEFEIERNPAYLEIPQIQNPSMQNIGQSFQQIGALRQYLDQQQNIIQSRGTLTVKFLDMMQRPQIKPFQVTLEDIWKFEQHPGQPLQPGSIQGRPDEAISEIANCVDINELKGILDDAWFGNGNAQKGYSINSKTFTAKILDNSKPGCEKASISNAMLDKTSFGANNEVKLTVNSEASNINLLFDRSEMKDNTEIQVNGNLTINIKDITIPSQQPIPTIIQGSGNELLNIIGNLNPYNHLDRTARWSGRQFGTGISYIIPEFARPYTSAGPGAIGWLGASLPNQLSGGITEGCSVCNLSQGLYQGINGIQNNLNACPSGNCPLNAINSTSNTSSPEAFTVENTAANSEAKISFNFIVKKGSAEQTSDQNQIEEIPSTQTGTSTESSAEAMKKYCEETLKGKTGINAMPKIKLDWKFENIEQNACDTKINKEPDFYCDSTQFLIEAVKKAKAIKPLIEKAKTSIEFTKEKIDYTFNNNPENYIKELSNSTEIYRFLTEQKLILDDSSQSNNKLAFFLASDGNILSRNLTPEEKIKIANGLQNSDLNALTSLAKNNDINASLKIMNAIQSELADSIIVEIKPWWDYSNKNDKNHTVGPISGKLYATSDYGVATLNELGAEYKIIDNKVEKIYFTFKEFKLIFEKLNEAKKTTDTNKENYCDNNQTQCYIKQIKTKNYDGSYMDSDDVNGKTKITVEFLRNYFNNATFKIGVRNQKEISQADKDLILQFGKRIQGAETLTKDFYYENIDFNVLLVKDNLDNEFAKKFQKEYEASISEIPKVNDWNFSKDKQEDGKFNVKVKYSWTENENITIELKKQGELLEKSVFYKVGFDGKVKNSGNEFQTAINNEVKLAQNGTFATVKEFPSSETLYEFSEFNEKFKFNGKILELTENSITYLPTEKVSISAVTTGSSGAKKGMEYRLIENNKELTKGKLITWVPDKETTNVLCNYTPSNQNLPFARSILETGNFKANLFLPQKASFALQLVCAAGTAKIESNEKSINASGLNPASSGANLLELKQESEKQFSIAELLEQIKNNKVCVVENSENSKLELYWN